MSSDLRGSEIRNPNPQCEIINGRRAFVSGRPWKMVSDAEMQTAPLPMKTANNSLRERTQENVIHHVR